MDDNREMFEQINALVGAIGKALEMDGEEAARALEAGSIALSMEEDEQGQRYIGVDYGGRSLRIYPGAIQYAPGEAPEDEPASGCGEGGCGCH